MVSSSIKVIKNKKYCKYKKKLLFLDNQKLMKYKVLYKFVNIIIK